MASRVLGIDSSGSYDCEFLFLLVKASAQSSDSTMQLASLILEVQFANCARCGSEFIHWQVPLSHNVLD